MRKDKELQKIMIDYCYREVRLLFFYLFLLKQNSKFYFTFHQNLDRNITRFLYDDQRVFEYQTPAELNMKDGAVLEVFLRMDGGRIL